MSPVVFYIYILKHFLFNLCLEHFKRFISRPLTDLLFISNFFSSSINKCFVLYLKKKIAIICIECWDFSINFLLKSTRVLFWVRENNGWQHEIDMRNCILKWFYHIKKWNSKNHLFFSFINQSLNENPIVILMLVLLICFTLFAAWGNQK